MRLTFLGTGPSRSIPRKGHRDPLCRDARKGGKSRRLRSAAVLSVGGKTILIDAGPDIYQQLNRYQPARIDAVLLTHAHADAGAGIRKLGSWLSRKQHGSRVPLFGRATALRRLREQFGSVDELQFRRCLPYRSFSIGPVTITPFPVRHSATPGWPTLGFSFGRRLAYASDVSSIPQRSLALLRGTRTLVLDGTTYFNSFLPTHLSVTAAIDVASAVKARKLMLTQIGHSYPPHDEAMRAIRRYWKTHGMRYPTSVGLAYDGLSLTT